MPGAPCTAPWARGSLEVIGCGMSKAAVASPSRLERVLRIEPQGMAAPLPPRPTTSPGSTSCSNRGSCPDVEAACGGPGGGPAGWSGRWVVLPLREGNGMRGSDVPAWCAWCAGPHRHRDTGGGKGGAAFQGPSASLEQERLVSL